MSIVGQSSAVVPASYVDLHTLPASYVDLHTVPASYVDLHTEAADTGQCEQQGPHQLLT